MNQFDVWLRAVGAYTKLHVEGVANADWLRRQLEHHGFRCAAPLMLEGTERCVFRVQHTAQMQRTAVREFIEGLPEVHAMHAPE